MRVNQKRSVTNGQLIGGCVLRGHKALTAARGANLAFHSSHPPIAVLLTMRTRAVQSITASAIFSFHRPPPSDSHFGQPLPAFHLSTLRLMLASSFSVRPPTPRCLIALDSSQWHDYLTCPSWYWAKGQLSMYSQNQALVGATGSVYVISVWLGRFPVP